MFVHWFSPQVRRCCRATWWLLPREHVRWAYAYGSSCCPLRTPFSAEDVPAHARATTSIALTATAGLRAIALDERLRYAALSNHDRPFTPLSLSLSLSHTHTHTHMPKRHARGRSCTTQKPVLLRTVGGKGDFRGGGGSVRLDHGEPTRADPGAEAWWVDRLRQ